MIRGRLAFTNGQPAGYALPAQNREWKERPSGAPTAPRHWPLSLVRGSVLGNKWSVLSVADALPPLMESSVPVSAYPRTA